MRLKKYEEFTDVSLVFQNCSNPNIETESFWNEQLPKLFELDVYFQRLDKSGKEKRMMDVTDSIGVRNLVHDHLRQTQYAKRRLGFSIMHNKFKDIVSSFEYVNRDGVNKVTIGGIFYEEPQEVEYFISFLKRCAEIMKPDLRAERVEIPGVKERM